MNRLYRKVRKIHRLATIKEMKISAKRVLRVEAEKTQMFETRAILALTFEQYFQKEMATALLYQNYERANELNLLKNR
jgi:hypothetical protein